MDLLWERMTMASGKKSMIQKNADYEASAVWILPSGLALNRHRIMFVSPAVDATGKPTEEVKILLEIGDQPVQIDLVDPRDKKALRQAILALAVEIG